MTGPAPGEGGDGGVHHGDVLGLDLHRVLGQQVARQRLQVEVEAVQVPERLESDQLVIRRRVELGEGRPGCGCLEVEELSLGTGRAEADGAPGESQAGPDVLLLFHLHRPGVALLLPVLRAGPVAGIVTEGAHGGGWSGLWGGESLVHFHDHHVRRRPPGY